MLAPTGQPLVYLVQGAEKTFASFRLTVTNPGGHSSRPRDDNAIYDLSRALLRVEAYRFPATANALTRAYLGTLGRIVPGPAGQMLTRFAANPEDAEAAEALRRSPEFVGTTRTTCIATMLDAGHAENALPQRASAIVNCRIFPGVQPEAVRQALVAAIGNEAVRVETTGNPQVGPVSETNPAVNAAITASIHRRYPGVAISPYLEFGRHRRPDLPQRRASRPGRAPASSSSRTRCSPTASTSAFPWRASTPASSISTTWRWRWATRGEARAPRFACRAADRGGAGGRAGPALRRRHPRRHDLRRQRRRALYRRRRHPGRPHRRRRPRIRGARRGARSTRAGLAVAPGFINMLSWATECLIQDGREPERHPPGRDSRGDGRGLVDGPAQPGDEAAASSRGRATSAIRSPGRRSANISSISSGAGIAPNVASFVGAATVRIHELGEGDVDPDPEQLARMRALVRAGDERRRDGRRQLAHLRARQFRRDRRAGRPGHRGRPLRRHVYQPHALGGRPHPARRSTS